LTVSMGELQSIEHLSTYGRPLYVSIARCTYGVAEDFQMESPIC
jgi:hypothetical protein